MGEGRLVNVEVSSENIDKLVESQIQIAMLEALSEDSEALVRNVVMMAMRQKCDIHGHNHYSSDKKTVFQCKLQHMVRDSAAQMFDEWLTEHHTLIRQAIDKHLRKAPKRFVDDIAKAMVEGLGRNLEVKFKKVVEEPY